MTIKKGDFLVLPWGATMRGYHFYEVVSVDKSKICLTTPQVERNGDGQEGQVWISGAAPTPAITTYAKIIKGKIKLCSDQNFKVSSSYWNTLQATKENEKFHYYGD